MSDQARGTEQPRVVPPESLRDPGSPPPPEPPGTGSPTAPDPEDWESTAVQGDDERYERERPPHWE